MPSIQKLFYIDITLERFVDNCSDVELQELILLAASRLRRNEPAPSRTPKNRRPAIPEKRKGKVRRTAEDDAFLRKNLPSATVEELAELMNRSVRCIYSHVKKLKIKPAQKAGKRNPEPPAKPEPEPVLDDDDSAGRHHRHAATTAAEIKSRTAATRTKTVRIDPRTVVIVPEDRNEAEVIARYSAAPR